MTAAEKTRTALSYVEVTEQKRLNDARELSVPWKKWGPYLSERQWGTVREDYSEDGTPGTISLMTNPDRALTNGVRTAGWPLR